MVIAQYGNYIGSRKQHLCLRPVQSQTTSQSASFGETFLIDVPPLNSSSGDVHTIPKKSIVPVLANHEILEP